MSITMAPLSEAKKRKIAADIEQMKIERDKAIQFAKNCWRIALVAVFVFLGLFFAWTPFVFELCRLVSIATKPLMSLSIVNVIEVFVVLTLAMAMIRLVIWGLLGD